MGRDTCPFLVLQRMNKMIGKPVLGENVFIAEGAKVLGDVRIGDNSSIWFNAVVRADKDVITIGKNTNVQDNAVLHLDPDGKLEIGDCVTIGHSAIVHGCKVGDNTLIGMGAIVMNHAVIGDNCIIGAATLVTEGMVIPDGSVVIGSPAKIKRSVSEEDIEKIHANALTYVKEAKMFKDYFS